MFERIRTMATFNEQLAAEYMRQILSATVYMHNHNIVHRDLKPENILFDSTRPDASIKVIDFGASAKLQPNSRLTRRLGTPYYVAPEVNLLI